MCCHVTGGKHENFGCTYYINAVKNVISHITQCPQCEKNQYSTLRSQNGSAFESLVTFCLINSVRNVIVLSLPDNVKPELPTTLRTCTRVLSILHTNHLIYCWNGFPLLLI